MALVVTDKCLDCYSRACIPVCPIDCFYETDGRMVFIDPLACIDCVCCYMACPEEAIFTRDTLPESLARWCEINAEMCRRPDAKRLDAGMITRKVERTYVPGRSAASAYERRE